MKTTSGGSQAKERVVEDLVGIANMVGPSTTDSLGVGEAPSDSTDAIESRQEETHPADAISEDGISPDDAPEVALGDIDEEVRIIPVRPSCVG
jgi:hypothetical protein